MERLAINERISAARQRVEAEGRSWGRPRSLDATQVAKVVEMRRRGRSLRQIAAACRLPLSTIGDSLRRSAAR
jgi:DNA invertase Pin-like site-specific DNA recombinase